MATQRNQYWPFLLSLLINSFLLPRLSAVSSPPKISYSNHCKASVSPSTPTSKLRDPFISFEFSGYFSGGDKLLSPDPGPSSPSSPSIPIPQYFYFYTEHLYATKTPGVLQLDGTLAFEGRTRPYKNRKKASFRLSGFWSESTGELCMVGPDGAEQNGEVCSFGSGCKKLNQGTSYVHSIVFKLNYAKISNISTSIISGTVESLDSVDGPSYFDPISIISYAQMNYEHTVISQVRDSCSRVNVPKDSLGLENRDLCSGLGSLLSRQFGLESGNFGPFSDKSLGFSPIFMTFKLMNCPENGKMHMYIQFSDNSYGFDNMLIPEKSLVGEGFWDGEKKKICLLACPILSRKEYVANVSVGPCSIGLSLWFPSVYSLRNRSRALGQIWSNKDKSDPGYFPLISFQELGTAGIDLLSGWRYEYTELDAAAKSSCMKDNNAPGSGNKTYPTGSPIDDLRFSMRLKGVEGDGMWGFAAPLTFGETEVPEITGRNFPMVEYANQSLWNVSYRMRYSFMNSSLNVEQWKEISAEGMYNAVTGKLCLVGCQYPGDSVGGDSMDCKLLIDVQLPSMNPADGEYLTGKISSTREKSDPLYFETLEISSEKPYEEQAMKSILRVDIEIAMVLISLTLSCIFILLQLFHVKKHQEVLPSISITMLSILTVGHMIRLVLNFKAMFFMNRNKENVLLWTAGWIEVNEVMVRVMTMVAFLLQYRLLQSAWYSRSDGAGSKGLWTTERKVLKLCLPTYFVGALIAWFVHSRSYESQMMKSDFNAEHPHSLWEDLVSYSGLMLDGFLLPQIVLNTFSNSKVKALNPFFYIGTTAVRALPHVYDAYRTRHYSPRFNSSYIYARPEGELYSSAWDIIVPLQGFLFALLVYLQQRFGGGCLLPQKPKIAGGYEMVPMVSAQLVRNDFVWSLYSGH